MVETSKKFEMRRPLVMCEINREQLDNEIAKGITDIEEGRVYSAEEVEKRMREMYSGIDIKRYTIKTNLYIPMTEEEMLAKSKESREQGKYRDADEVISDMRSKFGL